MPTLAQHQSNKYTKMLFIGHSKAGKTGAMTPLVPDFNLRILDFDNGLDVLKMHVQRLYPERLSSVEYVTLRDTYKMTPTGPECTRPTAFYEAQKLLTHWKYDDVDLGAPAEWGPDCILVIDSFTFMSTAAFNAVEPISGKDKRAAYGNAQRGLEKILAIIQSDEFETNVIVTSHIRYVELEDGRKKGFPTSIGEALSPVIPRYFNTVALCEVGNGGKRTIQTAATASIDLASPNPFEMLPRYDIETGLADIFKVLRPQPAKEKPTRPQVIKPTFKR